MSTTTGHGSHAHATAHGHGHEHNAISHVTPVPLLLGVFVALLALTALTVAAIKLDLGPLNVWIAMGIASVKALLVALFFMHLKYDRPFNALVFIGSLLFAALFVTISLLDTHEYRPLVDSYRQTLPVDVPTAPTQQR